MLRLRGQARHLNRPLVGRVTWDATRPDPAAVLVLPAGAQDLPAEGAFRGVLVEGAWPEALAATPGVSSLLGVEQLREGDVVSVDAAGRVQRQYQADSYQNFLLATERCNSNCLMCSQPPKDRNDVPYLMDLYRQVIPLIPASCPELGITGGEPTLLGDQFFELIALCQQHLPTTELHCLTNGRTFAWQGFAERLGALQAQQLMLGVPLYADHYRLHDYVVQARGAFDQTVQGLHNLAYANQRLEIRVVLHQLSVPRLVKLAQFIYRNLPFVEHVTFMGLENTGYTPHNLGKLWLDPCEYVGQLAEAVQLLDQHRIHVSVYNHQLCTLPPALWPFARRSISDWKNVYLAECAACAVRAQCGGFFASCQTMHSRAIRAVEQVPEGWLVAEETNAVI